jgi:hypothetical protein
MGHHLAVVGLTLRSTYNGGGVGKDFSTHGLGPGSNRQPSAAYFSQSSDRADALPFRHQAIGYCNSQHNYMLR